MTEQRHPVARELMQVQRVPAIGARNVRGRELLFGNGQLVRGDVEEADLSQLLDHILAAVAARRPARVANAEEDAAAVLIELFGNLGA